MPSCWVMKFSKKPKKKLSQEGVIVRNRKDNEPVSPLKHRDGVIPDKGFQDDLVSKSSRTNRQLSRSDTFDQRPPAQPLPLPASLSTGVSGTNTGDSAQTKTSVNKSSDNTLFLPIPINRRVKIVKPAVDRVPSSSESLNDPFRSCPVSPTASNYLNGIKSTAASPPRMKQVDQLIFAKRSDSRGTANPVSFEQTPKNSQVTRLKIPRKAALLCARDYSMTSPSRSPISHSGQDPQINNSLSVGNSSRPECSPLPSPGMMSPTPRSRTDSGAITPLHPSFGGSSTAQPDHVKQQSHPLPLPPLKIMNPSPFSPSSTRTSPRTQIGSPSSPAYQWKKGRLLGSGTFGQVYIGFNSESGEMCAIKEVALFSNDAKSKESALQLGQEIALLSRLRHPNIVQYYGSATTDEKLYIFLEYVSGGSIHKILQEYGQLGEAAIQSYTQQILSGLAYLHARNTLHRDIKGANILVDPSGRVKLADFGMAKHITAHSCPLSFKGSPYWMAPEVIKNSRSCNFAVDIWSLGCTVLEMTTAKPPWSQYEGVAAMFKIGHSDELPVIPDHLSDEGKDFIMRCLQRNPRKRPTAVQLLEHPFVKSCASFERSILSGEPLETLTGDRFSERVPVSPYTKRNVSCPVSPVGTALAHSRSPRYMGGRLSPSPLSSPRATSGFSTPNHSNSSLPLHLQENHLQKGGGASAGFQNIALGNGNCYHGHKIDIFRGIVKAHLETEPRKSDLHGSKSERVSRNQKEQSYCEHLVLADQVSKQLLMNPLRLNPILEVGTKSKPFNMQSQNSQI